MKWVGISGSWRLMDKKVAIDVKREVEKVIGAGNGIVTGGALGVDYEATEVVIALDPLLEKLIIILPTTLEIYARHYRKRARQGVITDTQATRLIDQLRLVKKTNPKALIENQGEKVVNKRTYYLRNRRVAQTTDELIAFWVNKSAGTENTIEEARKLNKKVKIFSYRIA